MFLQKQDSIIIYKIVWKIYKMKHLTKLWVNVDPANPADSCEYLKKICITLVTPSPEAQSKVFAHYSDSVGMLQISVTVNGPVDVILQGCVQDISRVFWTCFVNGAAAWPISVPDEFVDNGDIVGILGFEAQQKFQSAGLKPLAPGGFEEHVTAGYTGRQVASLYNFPAGSGVGQKIGIVQLGGFFSQTELNAYFSKNALGTAPTVATVLIDGAIQTTSFSDSASLEVALDVQIISAICPKASITIYFAPNSMQGLYNCINAAGRANDLVSISWGLDESSVPTTYINSYASLIANLGVPVFISSGDNGSAGDTGYGLHVGFPASVPTAYACGGTTMTVNAAGTTIVSEVSWPGSGGGSSTRYTVPAWQTSIVSGSMRGVPDFSGNADPKTGYKVYTASTGPIVVGGTSAVAPLMAALFALVNENRAPASAPKIGSINSQMYTFLGMNVYRDITLGSNGAYSASRGWDPVTGLGVINGKNLLKELFPESATNPTPPTPTPPTPTPPTPTPPKPTPTPPTPPTPKPTPPTPPTPTPPTPPTPTPTPPTPKPTPPTPKPTPPTPPPPIFNSIAPNEIFIGSNNVVLLISGRNLQEVTAVLIQGKQAKISKTEPTVLTVLSPHGLIKGPAAITLKTRTGTVTVTGKVSVILQRNFARRLSNK